MEEHQVILTQKPPVIFLHEEILIADLEPVTQPVSNAIKWALHRSALRQACSGLTDEEIALYECKALSSWESL